MSFNVLAVSGLLAFIPPGSHMKFQVLCRRAATWPKLKYGVTHSICAILHFIPYQSRNLMMFSNQNLSRCVWTEALSCQLFHLMLSSADLLRVCSVSSPRLLVGGTEEYGPQYWSVGFSACYQPDVELLIMALWEWWSSQFSVWPEVCPLNKYLLLDFWVRML